jgi:DNA-directed RNA polymerase subunit RPC12/RpoP
MEFIVVCPHCKQSILIQEINCGIFRHGIIISSGEQIDPHAPKSICDELYHTNQIYGCGKPFRLIQKNNEYVAESCDYI